MKRGVSAERIYRDCKVNYQADVKDIRSQLGEQMRCLDVRQDSHMGMLIELQDFFRRRSDVEIEYARSLDKLAKNLQARHKQDKLRREQWPNYSTYHCWQSLLASTRRQSRDHATLGEIYNQQMTSRFQDIMDDMQRIHRKCKEIGTENHEELIKVLNELQNAMKTYHQYHGESIQAENKLRYVETQKLKAEQGSKSGSLSKKARSMEKQQDKKQKKYLESKQKALVARNEYLLSLDTANAAIQRYYCDDLHNIINCIDCGYHNSVERALMMHISADENIINSHQTGVRNLNTCVDNLDQGADKQRFLELFNQAFALPKKFEFQAHKGDEVRQISAQKLVQADLLERLQILEQNIKKNKLETDEMWKTIESVEQTYIELINQKDYDVTPLFNEELKPPKSPHEKYKKRSDRMDTEEFYITKFRDFTVQSNKIARLQAKFSSLQKALGEGSHSGSMPRPPSLPPKPKNSRRLGRIPKEGAPKLFGGSIEEYVEATGPEIPAVVHSCVRVINLYGRYHQGLFRVSGSHHEINEFKNLFEKGDDPLQDILCAKDINSVAGLLKLYFRELKEPLFPTHLFDELINCSKLGKPHESMVRVRELVAGLPRPIFVVARYLFAFLSHISEYSDENLMDAYNLAICFGPTLLPIPHDRDQVQFQNFVIDLVKNIILKHEFIFPKEIEGAIYEKIVIEEEDGDAHDAVDNLSDEDIDEIADTVSEEVKKTKAAEPDTLEAVAQYDFSGRTERELSFKRGDVLEVYEQASADWWRGSMKGIKGLIPAKYISVQSLREKEERRLNQSSGDLTGGRDKRKSTESVPTRPTGLGSDISASQPNVSLSNAPLTSLAVSSASKTAPSPAQPQSAPIIDGFSITKSLSRAASSKQSSHLAASEEPLHWASPLTRARSHTPTAPSPIHSGQSSPAIRLESGRNDVSSRGGGGGGVSGFTLGEYTRFDHDEEQLVDDIITRSTHSQSQSTHRGDDILTVNTVEHQHHHTSNSANLSRRGADVMDVTSASVSRETLLSRDSGFSQLSRETTPPGGGGGGADSGGGPTRSSSQELLEDDIEEEDDYDEVVVAGDDDDDEEEEDEEEEMVVDDDDERDIDDALAEIMHGVQSLEKQQQLDQKQDGGDDDQLVSNTRTPDLVIGLPVGQKSPSPAVSPKSATMIHAAGLDAVLSTAEVFANSNQSTLKKIASKSSSGGGSGGHPIEPSSSDGSIPTVLQSQPSADESLLMHRTASSTAALRHKHNAGGSARQQRAERERRLSDTQAVSISANEALQQQPSPMFQPRAIHSVKAPQSSRVAGVSADRRMTPEKSFTAPSQTSTPAGTPTAHDTMTPRSNKPPIKTKPPTLRKTFKSPDAWKKMKETQDNVPSEPNPT